MNNDTDIHIIGAGSTGLSAAFFLAQKGFHPVLYDKRPERKNITKALGVNPNTLLLFEGTGITERFLDNGWKCSCMNFWSRDKLVYRNDFSKVKHKYPFMLIQSQFETESILEEMLADKGIRVNKGMALESIVRSSKHTLLRFRNGTDTTDIETAMPVIGADGSHSIVREKCGVDFPGWDHKEDFRLIDLELDTPLSRTEGHYRFFPEGGMLMLHIRDGTWRLAGTVDNLTDFLPAGTRTGKVTWEATFRVGERVAERFSMDRIFLLGDAAHIHSPAGAKGMNTCIEDSHIFAGLLAEGREKDYHDVRHRHIQRMVGVLGLLTDKVGGNNFMGRTLRSNLHRFSFFFPLVMPQIRKFILGIK